MKADYTPILGYDHLPIFNPGYFPPSVPGHPPILTPELWQCNGHCTRSMPIIWLRTWSVECGKYGMGKIFWRGDLHGDATAKQRAGQLYELRQACEWYGLSEELGEDGRGIAASQTQDRRGFI